VADWGLRRDGLVGIQRDPLTRPPAPSYSLGFMHSCTKRLRLQLLGDDVHRSLWGFAPKLHSADPIKALPRPLKFIVSPTVSGVD